MATPTENLIRRKCNAARGQQNDAVEDTFNNEENKEEISLTKEETMPWSKKLGNFFSLTSFRRRQVNDKMLVPRNAPMLPLQLPDSDGSSKIIGFVLGMVNVKDLATNGAMLHRIQRESYNNGDIPPSYDEIVSKWILVGSIVLQIITILLITGLWYLEMSGNHGEGEEARNADQELEVERNKQRKRKTNLIIILSVSIISCILEIFGAIFLSTELDVLTNTTNLKSN